MLFFANVQMSNQGWVRSRGGKGVYCSCKYVAASCFLSFLFSFFFFKEAKNEFAVMWNFIPDIFLFLPFFWTFFFPLSGTFQHPKALKAAPSICLT